MSLPLAPSGRVLVFAGRAPVHALRADLRRELHDLRVRLLEPSDRDEADSVLHDLHPDLHLIEDAGAPANEASLRAIADDRHACQVPVMVIAERDMGPQEARTLLRLGAVDVALPPHHPSLLAARIEALIRLKRQVDQARELSVRDELTGLYNRRFFFERLEQEVARSQRTKQSMAVVLLDVDHFKKVNDTYGHPEGDAVLRGIAKAIARHTRKSDLAARVGGDEFALVLAASSRSGAEICASTLRARIAELELGSHALQVTVSLGAATFPNPFVTDPMADLVRLADEALLRAKAGGRDRVLLAHGAALAG